MELLFKRPQIWNLSGSHAMAKCYATGSKKKRSNFRVGKIIFRYGFIVTFKKYETFPIHVNIYTILEFVYVETDI